MAHRFDDAQLRSIVETFDHLSLSIYGTDPAEYEAMTQKRTYGRMLDGVRRIIDMASVKVSLEFRLLNKKTTDELQEWIAREVRAQRRQSLLHQLEYH